MLKIPPMDRYANDCRQLTDRHGDAGHEELHGVVPLLPLGLGLGVLLAARVLHEAVQAEQAHRVLKLLGLK